jgi:hypothetical protein
VKSFLHITTGSHDIVMKTLSIVYHSLSPPLQLVVTIQSWKCCQLYVKSFLPHYNLSSSHDIVMKMLSVICHSLSPPIQLVVTAQSWKCKKTINSQESLTSVSYSNCENVMKDDKRLPLCQCRYHVLIPCVNVDLMS